MRELPRGWKRKKIKINGFKVIVNVPPSIKVNDSKEARDEKWN